MFVNFRWESVTKQHSKKAQTLQSNVDWFDEIKIELLLDRRPYKVSRWMVH